MELPESDLLLSLVKEKRAARAYVSPISIMLPRKKTAEVRLAFIGLLSLTFCLRRRKKRKSSTPLLFVLYQ